MTQSAKTRVLLVDDDDLLRDTAGALLREGGFEVEEAASVNDALKLLTLHTFDVLLTDLHMPSAGDGLTLVSAMRHINPAATTIILSGFPEMEKAAAEILAQADEILVKPAAMTGLAETVRNRLRAIPPAQITSSIATILEEGAQSTIDDWLSRVDGEQPIAKLEMDGKTRSEHLPEMFRDLVSRLRHPLPLGSRALVSPAAAAHGILRRGQGYTAAMMVEESRMLQVSIFRTLQNNLSRVNFSKVLLSVMEIADEVDSQLAQAMTSFVSESKVVAVPSAPWDGPVSQSAAAAAPGLGMAGSFNPLLPPNSTDAREIATRRNAAG
jgi:DNA-binding response OmpR family regulator